MIKKQHTFYGVGGLILGLIGGIASAAFSAGADKQRINDILTQHTAKIEYMKIENKVHEQTTQKELDRFAEIIASQMTLLQSSIAHLNDTVSDLRTDVKVLQALMERMEVDLKTKINLD